MKCYQVDFADGYRMLVDANSEADAREFAQDQAFGGGHLPWTPTSTIAECVCLDDETQGRQPGK
jgi:predicted ATPase